MLKQTSTTPQDKCSSVVIQRWYSLYETAYLQQNRAQDM